MTAPLVAKTPYDVDVVAHELARVASLAKAMPPAWDGAKVAHGFTGTAGENLGRVLPGKGVALSSDLKSLGITKPIPHVFEKTLAMKAVEAFGGRERLAIGAASMLLGAKLGVLGMGEAIMSLPMLAGAITNYDGIINARANEKGEDRTAFIGNSTSVASSWHFPNPLIPGGGRFTPAAAPDGTVPNNMSSGALLFGLAAPTGADRRYLLTIGYTSSSTLNVIMLVDILAATSGISANTTTTQTVTHPALTRYTGGAGNLIVMEVTTALGATSANATANYTNQSNTPDVSVNTNGNLSMPTSAIVQRLVPSAIGVPSWLLGNGDYGVRALNSVRFLTAMGAGVLNAYVYRPLHFLPGVGANVYVERDSTVQIDGLTELVKGTDSALGYHAAFVLPSGTTTGGMTTFFRTAEG